MVKKNPFSGLSTNIEQALKEFYAKTPEEQHQLYVEQGLTPEQIAQQEKYVAAITPTTPTTPTPVTPTTPTMPTIPAPVIPTITTPPVPPVPTITTPPKPEVPTMPTPPTITVPGAPTPPPMPEVPTVPPYEPSPKQVEVAGDYADELAKWREAKGYGIPEDVQAKMFQRVTDTLKARETENIRVMKNNMESRQITNSGFVFANEMEIKANTTVAIANNIRDVQISSALMKMASFEKAMGATAQFIGYLADESAKAYAPKMAQWGMEAQYGLTEYGTEAQFKMAGFTAEVAAIMAQAQIDAQYGLTAVEIATKYDLTEYQAQVTINMAQAQMAGQYGLAGYGAQVQVTMAQFQADTLKIMTEWQGKMDLYKIEINQAYNLQNMQTLADLQLQMQNDQQAFELEMTEMEMEANEQVATTTGIWGFLGTLFGWLFGG